MDQTKTNQQSNIADILFQEGKINSKEHKDFLNRAKKESRSLYQIISEVKSVSDVDLAKARARQLDIPYINLKGIQIPSDTVTVIPPGTAKNYQLVPFKLKNNTVDIAMINPEDFRALEAIEFVTKQAKLEARIYVTDEESLDHALQQQKSLKKEVGEALKRATIELEEEKKEEGLTGSEVEKIVEAAPISEAVNVILRHAITQRASDIHIEPLSDEVRVRYRVDGVLQTSLTLPRKVNNAIVARIKVLSNMKIDEQRIPQDGRFDIKVGGKEIDFRVSTLPLTQGEKVEMRVLDKTKGSISLEELGLRGRGLEILKKNIKKPYGMILITGPTGAGKSTTLYSVLEIMNKVGVNIVTLEDPVEYFIPGVNQSQIKPEIGLTFASGLRSILRQDPDIIMVGEIRDKETAEMAVHSALTGHIMLSTLHTNDSIGSIPRLIDMEIEPFLLTASLNLVIAQRLVRRICPHCKKEIVAPPRVKEEFRRELADLPEVVRKNMEKEADIDHAKFYQGKGCRYCQDKGYQGRVGIFEVFEVSEQIREIVLTGASNDKLFEEARKEGLITMREDGMIKVLKGQTTIEEVLRVTRA